MDRALRAAARDPQLRRARRRPLRPAPGHHLRHPGHLGHLRRGHHAVAGADRPAATTSPRSSWSWPPAACRRPTLPDIPGRDDFAGPTYHTGLWPHEGVDFTGQRVGIIGTGSSALQSIPIIAEQAGAPHRVPAHRHLRGAGVEPAARPRRGGQGQGQLRRVPRAANRQMPSAFGAWLDHPEHATMEVTPEERRGPLRGALGARRAAVPRRLHRPPPRRRGQRAGRRVRARPHPARSSTDPEVAERLVPRPGHRLQAALRRHRLLRDVQPRQRAASSTSTRRRSSAITPTGVQTTAGEHELDALIFATGFDAMTGALLRIDIRGRDGLPPPGRVGRRAPHLPRASASTGFPNLFTITGPGLAVGAHQHDRVDPAARGVDRRLHRPPPRRTASATIEAERAGPGRTGWTT